MSFRVRREPSNLVIVIKTQIIPLVKCLASSVKRLLCHLYHDYRHLLLFTLDDLPCSDLTKCSILLSGSRIFLWYPPFFVFDFTHIFPFLLPLTLRYLQPTFVYVLATPLLLAQHILNFSYFNLVEYEFHSSPSLILLSHSLSRIIRI